MASPPPLIKKSKFRILDFLIFGADPPPFWPFSIIWDFFFWNASLVHLIIWKLSSKSKHYKVVYFYIFYFTQFCWLGVIQQKLIFLFPLGSPLQCYQCNSYKDQHCDDPFHHEDDPEKRPKKEEYLRDCPENMVDPFCRKIYQNGELFSKYWYWMLYNVQTN